MATNNGQFNSIDNCVHQNRDWRAVVSSKQANPEDESSTSHHDNTSRKDERCGCGPCQSNCLQPLAHPVAYLISICALVLVQGMQGGYMSSVVTTIEQRYDLWSSEMGLVFSSYDWTSLIALVVVSYYGDHYNRARWLGYGAILIAVALVLFTFPHLLSSRYAQDSNETDLSNINHFCNDEHSGHDRQTDGKKECDVRSPTSWAFAIFLVSQMINGIGGSPIYTLGPTYLYDNVKPRLYSVYAGQWDLRGYKTWPKNVN